MRGHLRPYRFPQQTFQRLGGMTEAQRQQLLARRIDVELHSRTTHRATSASWA